MFYSLKVEVVAHDRMSLQSKKSSNLPPLHIILWTFATLGFNIIMLVSAGAAPSLLHASSLQSVLAACSPEMIRGWERIRRWAKKAVQMPKHSIWCLSRGLFHASHTSLSQEVRKGVKTRSRLAFVLPSLAQREIFMRSSSEMERLRVTRRHTHAQEERKSSLCVHKPAFMCRDDEGTLKGKSQPYDRAGGCMAVMIFKSCTPRALAKLSSDVIWIKRD